MIKLIGFDRIGSNYTVEGLVGINPKYVTSVATGSELMRETPAGDTNYCIVYMRTGIRHLVAGSYEVVCEMLEGNDD